MGGQQVRYCPASWIVPMNREESASVVVKFFSLIAAIITALVASAIAGPEPKMTVSGFGGYPISPSIESMWLAGPDHRPLLNGLFPRTGRLAQHEVEDRLKVRKRQALGGTKIGEDNLAAFDEHGNRGSGSSIRQVQDQREQYLPGLTCRRAFNSAENNPARCLRYSGVQGSPGSSSVASSKSRTRGAH
jgi:hypothetical protein